MIDAAVLVLRKTYQNTALFDRLIHSLAFPKIIGGKINSTTWIFFFDKYAIKF